MDSASPVLNKTLIAFESISAIRIANFGPAIKLDSDQWYCIIQVILGIQDVKVNLAFSNEIYSIIKLVKLTMELVLINN